MPESATDTTSRASSSASPPTTDASVRPAGSSFVDPPAGFQPQGASFLSTNQAGIARQGEGARYLVTDDTVGCITVVARNTVTGEVGMAHIMVDHSTGMPQNTREIYQPMIDGMRGNTSQPLEIRMFGGLHPEGQAASGQAFNDHIERMVAETPNSSVLSADIGSRPHPIGVVVDVQTGDLIRTGPLVTSYDEAVAAHTGRQTQASIQTDNIPRAAPAALGDLPPDGLVMRPDHRTTAPAAAATPPETPSNGTTMPSDSRTPAPVESAPRATTAPDSPRVSDESLAALRERIPPHMQAHISIVRSTERGVEGVRVIHHPNFTEGLPDLLGVPQAEVRYRPGNTEGAAVFITGDAVEASVRPTPGAAHTPPQPSSTPNAPESPQATADRLRAEGEARADALMAEQRAADEAARARETAPAGRETPPAAAPATEAPPRATSPTASAPTPASVPTPEFQPHQGMLQSLQGGPYAGSGIVGAATQGSQVQLTFTGDVSAAEAARRVGLTPEQVAPHLTSVGGNTALTLPRETLSQGNQNLRGSAPEAHTPPAPAPATTAPATPPAPEAHATTTTPPASATTPTVPDPDATIRPGAGAEPPTGHRPPTVDAPPAPHAARPGAQPHVGGRVGGGLFGVGIGAVVAGVATFATTGSASAAVHAAGQAAGGSVVSAVQAGNYGTAALEAASILDPTGAVGGIQALGEARDPALAAQHGQRARGNVGRHMVGRIEGFDEPDSPPIPASVLAQARGATSTQRTTVTGGETDIPAGTAVTASAGRSSQPQAGREAGV